MMSRDVIFVFIVGVPRSGTSWLHKMVAAHPKAYSLTGSNTFLQKYIFPLEEIYQKEKEIYFKKGFSRGLPSKLNKNEFETLLSTFIEQFYSFLPNNRMIYVEKATDLTAELDKIKKYLPNSKFIHIVRDGRNSTISRIKNRKSYGKPFGVRNVYEGAQGWIKQLNEIKTSSVFNSVDFIEIKYEEILVNPERHLSKIFEHIGLPFDSNIVHDICRKFDFKLNLLSRPNSEIIDKIGKPVQVYKKEMTKMDQALFEYIAGDMLDSFGYANNILRNHKFKRLFIRYFKLPFSKFEEKLLAIFNGSKRLLKELLLN